VAIVLSPEAHRAWKKAGSLRWEFGERIVAVRLGVRDEKGKDVSIFFVSAYAPVSNVKQSVRDKYHQELERCVAAAGKEDILLIATDANASMGVRTGERDSVLGPFGIQHRNQSGVELNDFCAVNGLVAATTFFQKNQHGTWVNPRSRKQHQLDHFLIDKSSFARVRDAGRYGALALSSDHVPIRLSLRIARNLDKQRPQRAAPRFNRDLLKQPDIADRFCKRVDQLQSKAPDLTHASLVEIMKIAASEELSSDARKREGWFREKEDKLVAAIEERNRAQIAFNTANKPSSTREHVTIQHKRLVAARRNLKRIVKEAKQDWTDDKIKNLGDGRRHPKIYWDALRRLKEGMGCSFPLHRMAFNKANGQPCTTPLETEHVVKSELTQRFNIPSSVDRNAIHELRQRLPRPELDNPISEEELSKAISHAGKEKATGECGIPVEFFQALDRNEHSKCFLRLIIDKIWSVGRMPEEWSINLLKLLPKKGDLHDINNWRGIMLMEPALKIFSSILGARLQLVLGKEGLESQCGFSPNRGCMDAIFAVKLALQKRHEHNLGTWAVFIDLIKAFDSVPRDGLYAVLEKFGVPPKFCSIIVALHEDLVVKATVGNVEVCVESTVGVKQGCTLAPILFLIYMQAGIELVNKESTVTPLVFKTRDDNIISGRNIKSDTGRPLEVVFSSSFFADDGAFLFESRRDLQEGMELVYRALGRLGMRCHIGRNGAMSKTEAMYFPPPKSAYDQADTTPLNIDGGHVHFTKRFKYLGSILSSNLKDDDEIDARIKAGSAAFASVRKQFFGSRQIRAAHKRSAYEGLVLSILLYGCEAWCVTSESMGRIRRFHNRCVRIMRGVNMWHTWTYHITAASLESDLGLHPIETYLAQRRLAWLGHVMRMDINTRLPKQLLHSWLDSTRPRGRPQLNYGQAITRDLINAGLNPRLLSTFTTDRAEWRRVCHAPDVHRGGGQRALRSYACILAVSALPPRPASLNSRPSSLPISTPFGSTLAPSTPPSTPPRPDPPLPSPTLPPPPLPKPKSYAQATASAATAPGPVSIRGAGPYKPPTPLPIREFTPIPCAVSRRSSRVGRGGLAESAGGYRLLSSRGH